MTGPARSSDKLTMGSILKSLLHTSLSVLVLVYACACLCLCLPLLVVSDAVKYYKERMPTELLWLWWIEEVMNCCSYVSLCLPLFISNALCFRTDFKPHIQRKTCVPCSPDITASEYKNEVSTVNRASRSACEMSLCGRGPFFRVICHAECISRIHIPTRWGILTYQGIQLGANLEEGNKGVYFYSSGIF